MIIARYGAMLSFIVMLSCKSKVDKTNKAEKQLVANVENKLADPDYTLTATEYFSAYGENVTRADKLYLGKIIRISGTIDNVGPFEDYTSVNLKQNNNPMTVQCILEKGRDNEAADFRAGDSVTISGTGAGYNYGEPALITCRIISQ